MIAEPLSSLGADHEAEIVVFPADSWGVPGRTGAPEIVMVFEAVERSDSPYLLTATTVKE